MEARAITAMRTGNLIFKNWCPWKFLNKNNGDMKCLYPPCQELDSLKHVLKCDFYNTKFVEGSESSTKDWARYLVKLNAERIKEFDQPLISLEGWTTYKPKMLEDEDETFAMQGSGVKNVSLHAGFGLTSTED